MLVVASAMYIYGFLKYAQFGNPSEVTKSVATMTGMELMWAFYGYSKPYAILLGVVEIVGSTLLLIRKTRILGGFLLTGILMNIIAQDFFYGVNEGALRAAIIYQTMILGILWINRAEVIGGIKALILHKGNTTKRSKNILLIVVSIIVAVLLKWIEFKLSH